MKKQNLDFLDKIVEPYFQGFGVTIKTTKVAIGNKKWSGGMGNTPDHFNELKDTLFNQLQETAEEIVATLKKGLESRGRTHKIKNTDLKKKISEYVNHLTNLAKEMFDEKNLTKPEKSNLHLIVSTFNSSCESLYEKLSNDMNLFLESKKLQHKENSGLLKKPIFAYLIFPILVSLCTIFATNFFGIPGGEKPTASSPTITKAA